MKKTLSISWVVFAVVGLVSAFLVGVTKESDAFRVAANRYADVSAVNEALVLRIGADLAHGGAPDALTSPLAAALIREEEAVIALQRVTPGWWSIRNRAEAVDFVRLAKRETAALRGVSSAVTRLAELPPAEWSETITLLREESRQFADAREEVLRRVSQ